MAEKLVMATSAVEAAGLKNSESAFLAGGTEDNRLNSSVDAANLISIGRIPELDGISKDGECIRIGAMSTFQEILDNKLVPEYLKDACRFMGSRTKRNMATIGGNIALRRTDSYLYPTLLASHAMLDLMDAKGNVSKLPSSARLAASYELPVGPGTLAAALDADYYFSGKLGVSAGVHYGFKDLVFVRAGYRYATAGAAFPSHLALGLGVKWKGIGLDVSYLTANAQIGNSLCAGLSYRF